MGALTQETDRAGHYSPKRGAVAACGWLLFAVLCWIVRGTLFGWFMTPSLAALMGLSDPGFVGGSSENTIALEDLALLAMTIAGVLCAVLVALLPPHRWRRR